MKRGTGALGEGGVYKRFLDRGMLFSIPLVGSVLLLAVHNYTFFKDLPKAATPGDFLTLISGELLYGWFVYVSFRLVSSSVMMVAIDGAGVRATLFSKVVFAATWEELAECSVTICTSKHYDFGIFFFSKQRSRLRPEKVGSGLLDRFTNSRRVILADKVSEILKPELLQYIPLERLVWIRDKNFSQERFYAIKAHALLELDKFHAHRKEHTP